jgi:hypothetical protein
MRGHSRSGFTLAEVMVSFGILGFLMLLYAASSGMIGKYTHKNSAAEKLQKHELNLRLDFAVENRFRTALDLSSDDFLKKCLTVPCTDNCQLKTEWQPLAWKNIPLYKYFRTSDMTWVYVPSAHDLKRDWKVCPELPRPVGKETDNTWIPQFAPECTGRAMASWRSFSGGAAEIKIQLNVADADLSRTLRYYVPFARNPGTNDCSVRTGVICFDPNAYLLNVDVEAGSALCGDPAVQGGS